MILLWCLWDTHVSVGACSFPDKGVCVFITGEGESQKKGKQIWSYEERRRLTAVWTLTGFGGRPQFF